MLRRDKAAMVIVSEHREGNTNKGSFFFCFSSQVESSQDKGVTHLNPGSQFKQAHGWQTSTEEIKPYNSCCLLSVFFHRKKNDPPFSLDHMFPKKNKTQLSFYAKRGFYLFESSKLLIKVMGSQMKYLRIPGG